MGKILSKADIFSKKGLTARTVSVPEWGGDVRYRPMSMSERREIRKRSTEIITKNGSTDVQVDSELMEVYTVITCVLDPKDDAKLMFGPDDLEILESQMSAGGISTIAQAVLRDSGMGGEAAFRGEEDDRE